MSFAAGLFALIFSAFSSASGAIHGHRALVATRAHVAEARGGIIDSARSQFADASEERTR